jgi:hypothetical protein
MSPDAVVGSTLTLGLLFFVVAVIFGLPFALGVWSQRVPRFTRRPDMTILGAVTLVYLPVLAAFLFWVGPWRSGVVVAGKSRDGRDYCVVQTFQDLAEPFRVALYVRTDGGAWRWYYLEHEDCGWRSARVEIVDGVAHVLRNGAWFRDVPLSNAAPDLRALAPDERGRYRPASYDAARLAADHATRWP